jgi:RNA polymerase sigma-70 factor (family 1)
VQEEKEIINAWMVDEKAFELLFKSQYEFLCRRAYSLLNDMDEAEETVQHVFITIWEKRNEMQVTESINAYLSRAVRNAALNRIKHMNVRLKYSREQQILMEENPPLTEISHEGELKSRISAAIESLPDQCRLIFKLSRFEEMKYAEIAEQLGLSIKTVENQMGKALKVLREKLQDYMILIFILMQQLFFS